MSKIEILTKGKSFCDKAVTSNYLNIVFNSVKKIENSLPQKKIYIIDECKLAFKYSFSKKNNVILWIQGVVPEEAILQGYSKFRFYIHSAIEYIVLRRAKFILFCSDEMKRHYERKYKQKFDNSFIMPCFNENQIDQRAFESKYKYDNNTFTYIGSLHTWQCFDFTLKVYCEIEKLNNFNTKLIICTEDTEKAKESVLKHGIKNYEILFANSEKLGEILNQVKYGFVLREDNIVNYVATPTKLSNYLSHGVIPIYSASLKSFDQENRNSNGFGVVCNISNFEKGISNIQKSIEQVISCDDVKKWCEKIFSCYYNKNYYENALSQKIFEKLVNRAK